MCVIVPLKDHVLCMLTHCLRHCSQNYDASVVNEVVQVRAADGLCSYIICPRTCVSMSHFTNPAMSMARRIAIEEGIMVGGSSGAAVE